MPLPVALPAMQVELPGSVAHRAVALTQAIEPIDDCTADDVRTVLALADTPGEMSRHLHRLACGIRGAELTPPEMAGAVDCLAELVAAEDPSSSRLRTLDSLIALTATA